ncbi:flavin reductase family protein [Streptomyces tendae]|uniref:flavin reductase family protein n=1 Tax=Streptomyces tendae TaxID=1932 RepID=UPI003441F1CC
MAAMDVFLDRLDPDMCVVTAAVHGERAGCLVGFSSQCSIRPVRYVVWISDVNRTFRVARSADVLAVHLLARDQRGTAELFGGLTGDDVDKFRRVRWREAYGGAAVLVDVEAWFVGRVVERTAGGDHVGFVLEPVEWGGREGAAGQAAGPLLRLADARTVRPGHPVD